MAGSINKAIIVGHLGKDPESRTFQNGGRIVTFSVATSERWKDKATGEPRERTEWHRIVVLNENLQRVAEQYLRKGSKVYLEGQIETRKATDQAGGERYFTEIVLRPFKGEITLLDRQDNGSRGTAEDYDRSTAPRQAGSGFRESAPSESFGDGSAGDMDDEIPF